MVRIIPLKLIKGIVFNDSNFNDKKDASDKALKGVTVSLFHAAKTDIEQTEDNKDVDLYREKLIKKTKTNEKGEYKFYVTEGRYSINLDIDSLPSGKGVASPDVFVGLGDSKDIDFAVKDVHTLELENIISEIMPGEPFVLNPVAKDKKGIKLAAKVDYLYDNDNIQIGSNYFKARSALPNRKAVNVKMTAGLISKEIPLTFKTLDRMSLEEARNAYKKGVIDERTKISHYLNTLSRSRKSHKQGPEAPIKSATTAVKEIQDYIKSPSSDRVTMQEAEQYMRSMIPDLDRSYTSPTGYFKIHYTTKGSHAVSKSDIGPGGVPRYIVSVGESFEHVKRVTCDTRGFRSPILEDGKDYLDIYVYNLEGVYGITRATEYYSETSAKQRRASCNISIDNNYAPSKGFKDHRDNCMKVTCAHEFFHAVQYAYNVESDSWWKEASATWNEDEIYDNINDYVRYINKLFSSPEKSLEQSSYGGVVFAKYLSENLGGYELIKRIWDIQGTIYDTSIKAIDKALKEKYNDRDISSVFKDYAACNFNPSQYYSEGPSWKESVSFENTFTEYPVNTKRSALNHLASSYQLLKPQEAGTNRALKITVSGARNIKWGFKIQRRRANDNKCSTTEVTLSGLENRAEIVLKDFGSVYNEICLIPVNLDNYRDGLPYSYSCVIE